MKPVTTAIYTGLMDSNDAKVDIILRTAPVLSILMQQHVESSALVMQQQHS